MKYLHKLALLGPLLLSLALPARAQRAEWGILLDTNNKLTSAVDGAGNIYVYGVFRGQMTLAGTTIISPNPGSADLFLAKLTSTGALRWIRQAGSYYNEDIGRVATDDQGNVFVSGSHGNNFSFGSTGNPLEGHFIARIDTTTGNPAWLHRLEGGAITGSVEATALAVGADGGCYLTGRVTATGYFEQTPIQNPGTRPNAFVAKYDRLGGLKWVRQVLEYNGRPTTAAVLSTKAIAVNPGGELAIGGTFRGRYVVSQSSGQVMITSTDTTSATSYRDAFLLRFGADGAARWGKVGAGNDNQSINGVAIDDLGNTYVAGGAARAFSFTSSGPVIGIFLGRFNSNGQTEWLRGQAVSTPSYFSRDDAALDLVVDGRGNTCMTGVYAGAALVLGSDTLGNGVYQASSALPPMNLFAAGYDPYGRLRWTKADTDTASAQGYFYGGRLGTDNQGRLYILGVGYGYRLYDNVPINATGSVGRSFLLCLTQPYQRVSGQIYLDQNANGYREPGEPPFPIPLMVTDSVQIRSVSSSVRDGRFNLWLESGSYDVRLPALPKHYYLTQGVGGYQRTLAAYANDSANYFGVAPVPNQPDVRITLAAYSDPRPGLITRYRAILENVGTTPAMPDSIGVRLDPRMSFISSDPVATQSLPDPTYYWPARTMAPFERREFDLQFSLPVNMAAGTVVRSVSLSRLSPDVLLADNRDTLMQAVTSSSASNSVSVNLGNITQSQLAAGRALEYTFRFQNLGNDTVRHVMILDSIDFTKIRRSPITYVGSSHSCVWGVGSDGVLRVSFPNIRLPSRNVNVLRSTGFIVLRMVPQASLTDGTVIENTAHIVFNFNNPIQTNTVRTVVGTAGVGLPEAQDAPAWSLFPNPTDHRTTLAATLPTVGEVRVQVLDPLGRELQRRTVAAPATAFRYDLDLTAVAPGLYLVRLTAPNGATVTRRVVRR